MKALIITVAGTATRFNKDTKRDTLKCLYYNESPIYSLLYQILDKSKKIDKFVIVGGYLYSELSSFINNHLSGFKSKIELVYNPLFKEYGSGYSLIKGIEALDKDTEEIVFVEGDLYFDTESYISILDSNKDVISVNREFISADKAVALYINNNNNVHYIYDTNHSTLYIPEPIKAIYNSAQIWKFKSYQMLSEVISNLNEQQIQGTNLEIIQGYFGNLPINKLHIIPVKTWFNCNTVADYLNVYKTLKSIE